MSKINNYHELVLERKKLENDLIYYKSILTDEVSILRRKMEPITDAVAFFKPSPNNSPNNALLQAGTNIGIEVLVRQKLLSKAGWFTKLVVPFLLKKVSARAIEKVQAIRK